MAWVDWSATGDIDNWLLNELDRIVPVNVVVVDKNAELPLIDTLYLSRYIFGPICSVDRDCLNCSREIRKFLFN